MSYKNSGETKYEEWAKDGELTEKLILVEGWARDGLNNEQIAHNLGIAVSTFYLYKRDYPQFRDAVKRGKEVVDYAVENALLRACLDGNVSAIKYWLNNRSAEKWKERKEFDMDIESTGVVQIINDIGGLEDESIEDEESTT